MLFHTWQFWCFFPAVYLVYLLLPRVWMQNALLLVASYWFYAAWDWRFLGLIIASTFVDYWCGLGIASSSSSSRKKLLLVTSLVFNLGLLAIFKYFDFFSQSFTALLNNVGMQMNPRLLGFVLPVGISFYTFQTLSYTIDIYRGQIKPTRNPLNFALFVAFFPQLVAGPIERAKQFLPQIESRRKLDVARLDTGGWLILWGLWKKVVVADNLGLIVDTIFDASGEATAMLAYLGMVAFTFQIYCDFSGYTDIARGLAKLLGFELMLNFNLPFAALNPADFWRRWHISLSTWLRDYLYIPLGGNRGGAAMTYRNLLITMVLGGLWHGAAWNFVIWGIYHGVILAIHRAFWPDRDVDSRDRTPTPAWQTFLQWFGMFQLTVFGFLIFRCSRRVEVDGLFRDFSLSQFTEMLTSWSNGWGLDAAGQSMLFRVLVLTLPLVLIQIAQWWKNDLYFFLKWPLWARSILYGLLLLMYLLWGVTTSNQFIYFQF